MSDVFNIAFVDARDGMLNVDELPRFVADVQKDKKVKAIYCLLPQMKYVAYGQDLRLQGWERFTGFDGLFGPCLTLSYNPLPILGQGQKRTV